LLLLLLVLVPPVIHDPTDRRFGGRRNFDQVKSLLFGGLQGGTQIHDAQLVALVVDDANLTGTYELVDIGRVLTYDPPPNDIVDILPG